MPLASPCQTLQADLPATRILLLIIPWSGVQIPLGPPFGALALAHGRSFGRLCHFWYQLPCFDLKDIEQDNPASNFMIINIDHWGLARRRPGSNVWLKEAMPCFVRRSTVLERVGQFHLSPEPFVWFSEAVQGWRREYERLQSLMLQPWRMLLQNRFHKRCS